MKRKASRSSPYERPTKIAKETTMATVSRNLSSLRRTTTVARPALAPVRWPALVPPSRAAKGTTAAMVEEVSEEAGTSDSVVGLRKVPTLTLADSESSASSLRKSLNKSKSKRKEPSVVASLSKGESIVSVDISGTVTTVTKLKSGSSIGETTSVTSAPPSVIKELFKAASKLPTEVREELSKAASTMSKKASLTKKVSSIRVCGSDASEAAGEEEDGDKNDAGAEAEEEEAGPSAPLVPLPPGGLIEIVFSFDTTGSMSSCLNEVRGRIGDMIQRLQADIPGIRIAVVAHGDYCDAHNYVIKWIDFGSSLPEMTDFVQNISSTGGGDFDECYELVMARVQTELSWTPGSQRSLVMIGDATPHPVSYYSDKDEKLDWEQEAKKLADTGVKIYAVQAMKRSESTKFYRTLATTTRGRHLKLDQFNNIFDIIMAVCYNEKGVEFVEAYEEEVRERERPQGLHKDLEDLFGTLKSGKASSSKTGKALPKLSVSKTKKTAVKGAAKGKAIAFAKATKAKAALSPGKAKAVAAKGKGKGAKAKGGAKGAAAKGKGTAAKGKGAAKGKATAAKGKRAAAKAKTIKGKAKTAKAKASAKAAAKAARGKGAKTVKGRKAVKADKTTKVVKKTKKTKAEKLSVKRKFRETVPDSELSTGACLQKVKWGPWTIAMLPSKPGGVRAWWFKSRSRGRKSGYKNAQLLQDSQKAPAVYELKAEIAYVKGPGGLKKTRRKQFVLGYRAVSKCTARAASRWESFLLNKPRLKAEVNALLQDGGRLYVRCGNVPSVAQVSEVEKHLAKYYDYAWTAHRRGEELRHRSVKRCGKLISGNDVPK